MKDQRLVCPRVLALVLPATFALSCVVRDWSVFTPQDKCKVGFTCTADWHCVRAGDGGMDGLLAVDSRSTVDGAGSAATGFDAPGPSALSDAAVIPVAGLDASEPDRAPLDVPVDAPLPTVPDAPAMDIAPAVPAADGPPDTAAIDAPPSGPTVDAAGSCNADKDCTGASARFCDTSTHHCVACLKRSDCAAACQTCSNGVCTAVRSQDDPTACPGTCDASGVCMSKQGQGCQATPGGCLAGTTCAPDGVCCDQTCASPCMACDIPGFLGRCTPVASGTPHGNRTSCGSDATCGGSCAGRADGQCSYPTVACGATASCSSTDKVLAQSSCANGTCPAQTATPCSGGFACAAGACKTTCTTSADCQVGHYCSGQKCIAGTPHKFVGGPCIITPSASGSTTSVVYGRGDDGHIYANSYSPGAQPAWTVVAGIDASTVAPSSDLDCNFYANSGSGTDIQMVALGSMPLGSVLRASGTGTAFSPFSVQSMPGSPVLDQSPSVVPDSPFDIVITNPAGGTLPTSLTLLEYGSNLMISATTSPTPTKSIISGTDVDVGILNFSTLAVVAFMSDGTMGLFGWTNYMGSGWGAPTYFAAPSGATFQYSPGVCRAHITGGLASHLVVTAGDQLWHSQPDSTGTGYTAWEKISDVVVASAPDCTVASDNALVSATALTTTGTILHVHGSNGAFTSVDLGTFQ